MTTSSSTKPPASNAARCISWKSTAGTDRISSPTGCHYPQPAASLRAEYQFLHVCPRPPSAGSAQETRDAFTLLQTAGILPTDLAARMHRMVGLRNVAVHEYTRLNLDIVHTIITKHLDEFRRFSSTIVKACA
ncbi:MAG: DUF86 domain-containing protein [Nitrospira sp.]